MQMLCDALVNGNLCLKPAAFCRQMTVQDDYGELDDFSAYFCEEHRNPSYCIWDTRLVWSEPEAQPWEEDDL